MYQFISGMVLKGAGDILSMVKVGIYNNMVKIVCRDRASDVHVEMVSQCSGVCVCCVQEWPNAAPGAACGP